MSAPERMRPADLERLVGASSHERSNAAAATPNGRRLMTAGQLADRWQVPKAQVYRLTREGKLPTVKIGRYYRYQAAAIEAFEAAGGAGSDG
jgi:excisionase family DNA binding protein